MGYTHYYKSTKDYSAQWKAFIIACKKLHKNLPKTSETAGGDYNEDIIKIAGGQGTGKPIFDEKIVCFNGSEKNGMNLESFYLPSEFDIEDSHFCKTARKPYDLLVVACIIAAWQILDFRFSSDGFKDGSCDDLQPAIDYYNATMKPETLITQEHLFLQRKEYHDMD